MQQQLQSLRVCECVCARASFLTSSPLTCSLLHSACTCLFSVSTCSWWPASISLSRTCTASLCTLSPSSPRWAPWADNRPGQLICRDPALAEDVWRLRDFCKTDPLTRQSSLLPAKLSVFGFGDRGCDGEWSELGVFNGSVESSCGDAEWDVRLLAKERGSWADKHPWLSSTCPGWGDEETPDVTDSPAESQLSESSPFCSGTSLDSSVTEGVLTTGEASSAWSSKIIPFSISASACSTPMTNPSFGSLSSNPVVLGWCVLQQVACSRFSSGCVSAVRSSDRRCSCHVSLRLGSLQRRFGASRFAPSQAVSRWS